MPLKQKVMFISQTSLQTSETCACVTGCTKKYFRLRAWAILLAPQNFSGTYTDWIYTLYLLNVHTRTLHECSLALAALRGALANMMLAWPGSEREASDDFFLF